VLSFILMGFAGNLGMLFFARILDGVTGGNVIVAQAYITDVTTRKDRTRALGLVAAAFGIGYSVGPAIGGALTAFGETVPFFAGAAISLVTVIITWLMLDETHTAEERQARRANHVQLRFRDLMHNQSLMLVLGIGFAAQFCMSLMQSTVVLYSEEVIFRGQTVEQIGIGVGILLGTMGVGQFLTQLALIKPIIERLGERRTVILGIIMRGTGLLTLALLTSPLLIGSISMVTFSIGSALLLPSLQSLATVCVSDEDCGGVLGIYGSSSSMGIILGSTISGLLYAAFPTLPFLTGGLVYVALLVPAFMLMRQERVELAMAPQRL
jgi:DHA1 family tetracycline resistance protein-like MFS transporter